METCEGTDHCLAEVLRPLEERNPLPRVHINQQSPLTAAWQCRLNTGCETQPEAASILQEF